MRREPAVLVMDEQQIYRERNAHVACCSAARAERGAEAPSDVAAAAGATSCVHAAAMRGTRPHAVARNAAARVERRGRNAARLSLLVCMGARRVAVNRRLDDVPPAACRRAAQSASVCPGSETAAEGCPAEEGHREKRHSMIIEVGDAFRPPHGLRQTFPEGGGMQVSGAASMIRFLRGRPCRRSGRG